MSFAKIFADLQNIVVSAFPLPDVADREQVKAFAARLAPAIVDLVYDGLDPDELEAALGDLANRRAAGHDLSAIGDGKIIKWIVENKETILALIQMIMGFIPKKPAVDPAPVTPPAPSPVG